MYKQIASNKRRSILLLTLFIIIILLLGWLLGEVTGYGYSGLALAIFISLFMSLLSYFKGDKIALWTAGAKPLKHDENPYVYHLVENLCITAGLPVPKIYIIPDSGLNAFATGRDPQHASIALTAGIVEKLAREELEGVIAHELSHIKNYDIRFMTLIVVCIGIVVLLSNWLLRSFIWGSRGRQRNNRGSGSFDLILLGAGIILAILSPLIAQLIQLAISRKREFLADASGVLLTRYPDGLSRALEKIASYEQPLLRANGATAHLYIANPFGKSKNFFSRLFSTHPPIEERIKALRNMIK